MPGGKVHFEVRLRPLLSIYTRTHSSQGEKAVLISAKVEAITKEMESIPIETKTAVILGHMKRRSRFMGDWVAIDLDLDWPLFHTQNREELLFILEHLRKDNRIEPEQFPVTTNIRCRLTAQGWQVGSEERLMPNRRAPDIDAVTKIPSRKQYDADLPGFISKSKEQQMPLALLVIDLDYFKKLNELAGHDGADLVLHAVAQKIQKILQGKGTVYRYGGDEMVAVLPNFELGEAKVVAERLRKEVQRLQHLAPDVKSTVTIGIAAYPNPVSNPEDLFAVADKKLLDTKKEGIRNRCAAVDMPAETIDESTTKSGHRVRLDASWQLTVTLKPKKHMPIPEHELLEYLIRCSYFLPLDIGRRYRFPLLDNSSNLVKENNRVSALVASRDHELTQLYSIATDGSATLTVKQKYIPDIHAVMGDNIFNGLLRFLPCAELYFQSRRYRDFILEVSIDGISGALLSVNHELLFTPNWISRRNDYSWSERCEECLLGFDAMVEFLLKIIHAITTVFSPQEALPRNALNHEWIRKTLKSYLQVVQHPQIGFYRS
jgi:diguanylate cyclase (GGDEF)-like protein